ncbi:MAG TPA: TolC family protein [Longimicrobiales bacterium]
MKFSRSLFALVLVFSAAVPLPAQEPARSGRPLSIEEALSLATARSEQVTIAGAGVERARGQQLQAKSQYYPQLNASANYSRALASEFEDAFGGASPDTTTTPPDSAGGGGGIDFSQLPFGRKNTYQFNLSLSQNLFAGGRIRAQNRVANASRTTAEIALAEAKAQVTLNVAQAYYDASLAERLADIAEETLAQAGRTLEQARLARQVGNQSEFELLRAQVARDNQVPVVIQQRSARDLALLRLKQLLDLPADEPIVLTTQLLADSLMPVAGYAPEIDVQQADSLSRSAVRQAAAGVQIREASLDISQAQRWPSLALTSNYTRVNYPVDLLPQFNDLRTNWTLGLNMQVPLFTGGRIKGDEVIAEANVTEARATLQRTKELAALDTRSALQDLAAAEAAWEASSGTVTQAERAHAIAELRYREGISTQLELNDARLLLQQAQANRARAARDLQVARVRIALLPDLPLGTIGGTSGGFSPTMGGSGAGAAGAAGAASGATTGAGFGGAGGFGGQGGMQGGATQNPLGGGR